MVTGGVPTGRAEEVTMAGSGVVTGGVLTGGAGEVTMAGGDVVTGGVPTGGAGEVTMAGGGVVTGGVPTGGAGEVTMAGGGMVTGETVIVGIVTLGVSCETRGDESELVSPRASSTAWLNCTFVFSCNYIKNKTKSLASLPSVRGK